MALKKKLKSLILRAGPLPVWRFFHRHELTILAIHGVMDEGVETRWTPLRKQLPRKQLDRVLGVLSKHYNIVSIDQAVQHLNGEIAPIKHPLVLTFDDGYANNFRHALPILKRHNAPAIFYVVTDQIESQQPFWFDRLDYALQKASFKKKTVHIRDQAIEIDNSNRQSLKRSYAALRKAAKLLDDDLEMRDTLNTIAASIETDDASRLSSFCAQDDWSAIADWETLKKANSDNLVTIGSHTVDHIRIGSVSDSLVREQLEQSRDTLSRELGEPCRHFCFPNGNYSDSALRIVGETGYQSAMTSDTGTNPPGCNVLKLSRTTIPSDSDEGIILAYASGLNTALMNGMKRLRRIGKPSKLESQSAL